MLIAIHFQLDANNKANLVAIEGQLYAHEAETASRELQDLSGGLSTIWTLVPAEVRGPKYMTALMELVTEDQTALQSKTPGELYHSMWDAEVFSNEKRRNDTRKLRELFIYTQENFYHIHSALDYREGKIMSLDEWPTWKGLIREMHAHPMLLSVIWQAYQNRYISFRFAQFLQDELCPEKMPSDVADQDGFQRDKEFLGFFYPHMCHKGWPDILPNY